MPASWPRLANCCSVDGANQRPAIQRLNASRASRLLMAKGRIHSGGIIARADSGSFSRWVPQNGHLSVATLSSSNTTAPHAAQVTCDDRPAMVVCSFARRLRYSS